MATFSSLASMAPEPSVSNRSKASLQSAAERWVLDMLHILPAGLSCPACMLSSERAQPSSYLVFFYVITKTWGSKQQQVCPARESGLGGGVRA